MFNFVALVICFLFLRAVWSFQLPIVPDDHALLTVKVSQHSDEFMLRATSGSRAAQRGTKAVY